jgi:hypothetical protein
MKGLGKFIKFSPHWVSNTQSSGLWHSASTITLPRAPRITISICNGYNSTDECQVMVTLQFPWIVSATHVESKKNIPGWTRHSDIVKRPGLCVHVIGSTNMRLFEVHYKQKLQLSKSCPLRGVKQTERLRDKRADTRKKKFKWDECLNLIVI